MKIAKKVIKRAFQSGVSFGAGLASLIVSFLFFAMVPRFQYIARMIQVQSRVLYGITRFELHTYRLVSFLSALRYILFVIGISLIVIGALTQYYRQKSQKS